MPALKTKKNRKDRNLRSPIKGAGSSGQSEKSRPGRKQYTWEHITPSMLESWQKRLGGSAKTAAGKLGVSLSCYYNWLRDQNVPTPPRQQALRRIIDANSPATPSLPTQPTRLRAVMAERDTHSVSSSNLASQVATVFQSYVTAQPKAIKPNEVPDFLRLIRTALST